MHRIFDGNVNPLGMGCWPIGGAMFSGDQSLGYSKAEDHESLRTIQAALDAGITIFDTAAAYGAGHSERLLGTALKNKPDARIITKFGIGIDETSKQLSFDPPKPEDVQSAIDASLRRLDRDHIDLLLLHQNDMSVDVASALFDAVEKAVSDGKVGAYGWSTDFSSSAEAMTHRSSFVAVEHAMNLFFDAPKVQSVVAKHGLTALIRSPLAMGLLSGKYGATDALPKNDIRAARADWMEYYKDGKANPEYLKTLDAVREILTLNGRSVVQGALSWIWAKDSANIPIPGARTVEQMQGITGALDHGPLPVSAMEEIENLIPRNPDEEERPR